LIGHQSKFVAGLMSTISLSYTEFNLFTAILTSLQATFTKDIVFEKYCLKRPLALILTSAVML
jgi:hypothetical protein